MCATARRLPDRPACEAVITYVAVQPGSTESIVLPDAVRKALTGT